MYHKLINRLEHAGVAGIQLQFSTVNPADAQFISSGAPSINLTLPREEAMLFEVGEIYSLTFQKVEIAE